MLKQSLLGTAPVILGIAYLMPVSVCTPTATPSTEVKWAGSAGSILQRGTEPETADLRNGKARLRVRNPSLPKKSF